jgi:hypothetical protein
MKIRLACIGKELVQEDSERRCGQSVQERIQYIGFVVGIIFFMMGGLG